MKESSIKDMRKKGADGKGCGAGPGVEFRELSWISSHGAQMKPHTGKWVALKLPDGIVASHESLEQVIVEWRKRYPEETPFVFMVPKNPDGAIVP